MTRMKKRFTIAERQSIMLRIEERCSSDISPTVRAYGAENDFVTIVAWPVIGARCEWSWESADRLSKTGGTFRFK